MRAPIRLFVERGGGIAYAKLRIHGPTEMEKDKRMVRELVFRPQGTTLKDFTWDRIPAEIQDRRKSDFARRTGKKPEEFRAPTLTHGVKFVCDIDPNLYFIFPGSRTELRRLYRR